MDTHVHDGLDEGFVGPDGLRIRKYAQQVHQAQVMVAAIGRQEADVPALVHGLAQILLELFHRQGLFHAHQLGVVGQRRHGAGPHDIVDGKFVAKDDFIAGIGIDNGRQAREVQAPEIEEGAVLAELVLVALVVHAHLVVTQEQKDAAAHLFTKAGAAVKVCLFTKHQCVLLFSLVHSFTNLCLDICWSVAGKYSLRRLYRPGSRSLSSSRVFT